MTNYSFSFAKTFWLALWALLSSLAGCSIPRDVPTQPTGEKFTEIPHLAGLQSRLNALNKDGIYTNPVAYDMAASSQGKYDWAKAQCWVRNAYSEYQERDAGGFIDAALTEAEKIIRSLELGNNTYKGTALINHKEYLRPDLWARAERIKKSVGFACAAPSVACLEVQLSRSGHEHAETGWRHANSYLAIAEDMAQRAETQAKECILSPALAFTGTTEKITLQISVLFRFDKRTQGELLLEDKAQLEQFAHHIQEVYASIEQINLVGYTDRLGHKAYNVRLSQDRADTVKAYLQSLGLVAPMTATGKGSANPVVQCKGKKASIILKNCLQPNRRVEIKVMGVKK